MSRSRHRRVTWRLIAGAVSALLVASALQALPAQAAGGPNLAAGKPTSASSVNGPYVAGNLTDGNQGSYWESSRRLPAVGPGRPRQRDQHRPGRAQAARPAGARAPRRCPCRAAPNGTASRTIVGSAGHAFNPAAQHRDDQLPRDDHPVRAGQHHRQHRLAGRAALRARGLRRRRTSTGNLAAGQARSPRAATPTSTAPATPTTATRPPTGRAPTTRSRSGSRSTSAPPSASTGSC